MDLEEKATQFANGIEKTTIQEKRYAKSAFSMGYKTCKTDLIEFLKVNHRASVKDILKHLEAMV